jgi:hypothetical protein
MSDRDERCHQTRDGNAARHDRNDPLENHQRTPVASAAVAVMALSPGDSTGSTHCFGLAWVLVRRRRGGGVRRRAEPARYAFGAMPAYFLLAAGLTSFARSRLPARRPRACERRALGSADHPNVRPSGAGGYEAAAQYVVNQSKEPAILFDSAVDTGFFVFFVRKHDPPGRLAVLRADKILTSPEPGGDATAATQADVNVIYSALRRFGIRWIAVEERTSGPRILRQLHEQLKTASFVERQRIPIVSREPEAQGKALVVYEYLEAQPPDLDAELDIGLPLGRREIKLRLRDLGAPRK